MAIIIEKDLISKQGKYEIFQFTRRYNGAVETGFAMYYRNDGGARVHQKDFVSLENAKRTSYIFSRKHPRLEAYE